MDAKLQAYIDKLNALNFKELLPDMGKIRRRT